MTFTKTIIDGVLIVKPKLLQDDRGKFVKSYNIETFNQEKLNFTPQENYYSISKRSVIRGMHFQLPPKDHIKIVYVTRGSIKDVVLDIRVGSPTYGTFVTADLSSQNGSFIYIPAGCAHGFLSMEDETCVVYLQSSVYSKDHDAGIKYDSFGMDWNIVDPVLSERDQAFPNFESFISPFKYETTH